MEFREKHLNLELQKEISYLQEKIKHLSKEIWQDFETDLRMKEDKISKLSTDIEALAKENTQLSAKLNYELLEKETLQKHFQN